MSRDPKPAILLFTNSSGFEREVIKNNDGKPSIVEQALRSLGAQHGFDVNATKDGRIFDSKEFSAHQALVFYTSGDLTKTGTDGNPPITAQGKWALLNAVHGDLGFATFLPPNNTKASLVESSNPEVEGEQAEPYLRMVGGEFLAHAEIQPGRLVLNDANFPGVKTPPQNVTEEWYSLKNLSPDMHVILTIDTVGMKGEPYRRPPYPVAWAHHYGKGRVFYAAMGHTPKIWQNEFFLDLVAAGIAWAMGHADAKLHANITKVAPGYRRFPTLGADKQ